MPELTALYERQLSGVNSMTDFRHARVDFDADAIVPREERERYAELPDTVEIRGKDVEIQYDVEENESGVVGVARLRLPEKIARNMSEAELPTLDRPLRFVVTRGMRGAARAATRPATPVRYARRSTSVPRRSRPATSTATTARPRFQGALIHPGSEHSTVGNLAGSAVARE